MDRATALRAMATQMSRSFPALHGTAHTLGSRAVGISACWSTAPPAPAASS